MQGNQKDIEMKKWIIPALLSLALVAPAYAACDVEKRSAEFSNLVDKVAASNPEKLVSINAELQAFAAQVEGLMSQGKQDEICKKLDALSAKLR